MSRASALRVLCEVILRKFTDSPIHTSIHTTINITMNETAPAASKNFSHAEIMHFLHLMEEILPMGNKEMKLDALKHAEVCPPGRSAHSLRRKFASLQRVERPTGDPNTPQEI